MRKRPRKTPKPCPFRPGDRIRPTAMFEHHDYEEGQTYVVVDIDTGDFTLRARDEHGKTGSWIRWADCRLVNDIGWQWLKGQLPAEALELLSAFNGLDRLRLRQEITTRLVTDMPSLKQRILGCIEDFETTTKYP